MQVQNPQPQENKGPVLKRNLIPCHRGNLWKMLKKAPKLYIQITKTLKNCGKRPKPIPMQEKPNIRPFLVKTEHGLETKRSQKRERNKPNKTSKKQANGTKSIIKHIQHVQKDDDLVTSTNLAKITNNRSGFP